MGGKSWNILPTKLTISSLEFSPPVLAPLRAFHENCCLHFMSIKYVPFAKLPSTLGWGKHIFFHSGNKTNPIKDMRKNWKHGWKVSFTRRVIKCHIRWTYRHGFRSRNGKNTDAIFFWDKWERERLEIINLGPHTFVLQDLFCYRIIMIGFNSAFYVHFMQCTAHNHE